jgi:hypothetical protein
MLIPKPSRTKQPHMMICIVVPLHALVAPFTTRAPARRSYRTFTHAPGPRANMKVLGRAQKMKKRVHERGRESRAMVARLKHPRTNELNSSIHPSIQPASSRTDSMLGPDLIKYGQISGETSFLKWPWQRGQISPVYCFCIDRLRFLNRLQLCRANHLPFK